MRKGPGVDGTAGPFSLIGVSTGWTRDTFATRASRCAPSTSDRNLRLDIWPMARRLLSAEAPAQARAGIRELPAQHDRDQRLVLLPSDAESLSRVVRRDARRFRLRGEGRT